MDKVFISIIYIRSGTNATNAISWVWKKDNFYNWLIYVCNGVIQFNYGC